MWNQFRTDAYEGMLAETVTMKGHNGDLINAYFTRPLGAGLREDGRDVVVVHGG